MMLEGSVLLVEDEPADIKVVERAFKWCAEGFDLLVQAGGSAGKLVSRPVQRIESKLTLVVHTDGESAMAYLRSCLEPAGEDIPRLVLLDLNLPNKDGREVLREIKADERLRGLPVVILTSSGDPRDVHGSYRGGANAYLRKPLMPRDTISLVCQTVAYWLASCVLPTPESFLHGDGV
jgi:CheY-like chemotaxis protein